jgi:3-keto-5-aminohexanoate cleavage enzyme
VSTPVILTAAIVGAEVTREQTPFLPITAAEIGRAAAEAAAAGASVIHLHVRDEEGAPTQDATVFAAAITEIRSRCDVILQVSTGGAVGMTAKERLRPVTDLPADLRPDMASLTTGSCNFGADLFLNPAPEVELFAAAMRERGIKPEIEVFEVGMVAGALRLVDKGLLTLPLHFNFVLGVPGALPATVRNLLVLVDTVPPGSTWTVSGIGRHQLPMSMLGLVLGGHVRTGLEDNIYYRRGEPATGSAQLVGRVARLAGELERPVASAKEARVLLALES